MANSNAMTGIGSVLSIGSGTGTPETFTVIGEITNIAPSGRQVGTEDVTNLASSAREFVPTLLDSGMYEVTGNRVPSDAGQTAMEAAFSGYLLHNFKLQLQKSPTQTTTGDLLTFRALVQEFTPGPFTFDKKIGFTAKLKISGAITTTFGS